MELGNPALHVILNRAIRYQDISHIDTLGPFAYALQSITANAEKFKDKEERLVTGQEI